MFAFRNEGKWSTIAQHGTLQGKNDSQNNFVIPELAKYAKKVGKFMGALQILELYVSTCWQWENHASLADISERTQSA